jgi:translation elongation factor EF-Ts
MATTQKTATKTPRTAVKKVALKKAAVTPTSPAAPRKAAKPVTTKKPVVTQQAAKPAKPAKVKKPKMVRDSFTMPKDEYVVIDSLKVRSGKLGQSVKKSELLRAGIKALAAMSDIQFKAALSNVPTIKTGRPTHAK